MLFRYYLFATRRNLPIWQNEPIVVGGSRVAEEVGWAVTRAARHVPFNAVCLPQAMAARIMLKRHGVDSVLHFGARIGQDKIGQDKPIDAHAWLDAAGVEVTGYPVANTFAEIACFV